MCFGNTEVGQKDTTYQANPAVAGASGQNLNFVKDLQKQGFTPYGGQQVANFSPLQQQSFGMAGDLASGGVQYVPQAYGLVNQYANAGPGSVNPQTIAQNMSPYMNQYVQQALQPQLALQQQQFDTQNRGADARATGAGAFGDPQQALYKSNLSLNQDLSRQGLIGQAYTSAFNTAIGAGAQDVANNLQGQTTNAGLREQALSRNLGGATALEGLGQYGTGQGAFLTGIANQYGGQQTAQGQAGLNAAYNQWLMGQQYPFQTAQLLNQTTAAGAQATPASSTTTSYAPNNAGWGMLGTLGGAAIGSDPLMGAMLTLSDERTKENVAPVGHLFDETPIYLFNYKADPAKRAQIGVMAQDLEATNPEAVHEIDGVKFVDYARTVEPSLDMLSRTIGG